MIVREINISQDHAIGEPVTMIDYGLKIKLTGLELPTAYEVHFSNSMNQPATVAIGDSTGVVVPYEYTEMSGTLYGWLYLHNDMTDGYTARSFALRINRRAIVDPPQVRPPQATVIEQAIIMLNMAIERTEAARDEAEESAGEAEQSAQQAAASAAGAVQSQSAAQSYAQQAQAAKAAAEVSAAAAEASATAAAESASAASASKAQAATDATRANTYATRAQTSATTASNAATSASNAAGAALNHANNAATSATAAQTAQTAAESAATTATGKATEAENSAQSAANSATAAEAAATRAEQTVTDSEAWALGAYATSSASGAVASVDDGAEGVPVKVLTAYIVPVQDLHGYDHPWPAGGGKNLFPMFANQAKNGVTLTYNDGAVYLNGTATTSFNFLAYSVLKAGTYTLSAEYEGTLPSSNSARVQVYKADVLGGCVIMNSASTDAKYTFSISNDGIYEFRIRAENGFTYDNVKLYPQVELGSEKTAYEPYENICPITGWTGMNLTGCGKNVYTYNADKAELAETVSGDTRSIYHTGIKECTATISATVINPQEVATTYVNIAKFKNGKAELLGGFITPTSVTTRTFSLADDEELIFMSAATTLSGITLNLPRYNIQIEVSSTTTAYEPYHGTTYPVTWADVAGTVYGGYFDAVTGVLTVTMASRHLDGARVQFSGVWGATENGFAVYRAIDEGRRGTAQDPAPAYCNKFVRSTNGYSSMPLYSFGGGSGASSTWTFILPSTVTTLAEANAWLVDNPIDIIVTRKPENYITYQLDPLEVKTLKGVNNIFADTGDTSVVVRADPDLHLSKLIAQAVAVALENA